MAERKIVLGRYRAKWLVETLGEKLVGCEVITEPMGCYPGGKTKVVRIHPDPNAPEIVFDVEWSDGDNSTVGVFDYEHVTLLPPKKEEDRENG